MRRPRGRRTRAHPVTAWKDPRFSALLPVAESALRELAAADRDRASLQVEHKGAVDLVTQVDRRLQDLILEGLAERFPGERVIAEEAAAESRPGAGIVWYVDPLDGTTNFVHRFPFHAVSIAAWDGDRPLCGIVGAPALGETWMAVAGQGAWVRADAGSWERLSGSRCQDLRQALLATGFPYARGRAARLALSLTATALDRARGVRRAGSAAIDVCYVAAGRLDGYFEMTLSPWDVAAAALIAREAGMVVTDFAGGGDFLWGGRICVAPDGIHGDLLRMLADVHADPEHNPLGDPFPGPVPLESGEDAWKS